MTGGLIVEPATDWTRQTNEERFILCAETLFIHGLINDQTRRRIVDGARDRATTWREHRAAFAPAPQRRRA